MRETDVIRDDYPVVAVGFGRTGSGGLGVKRQGAMVLQSPEAFVSTPTAPLDSAEGVTLCGGDSGGPSFLQLADGTWRLFGIHQVGNSTCRGGGSDGLLNEAIPWIDGTSRIDVTPCHDADGTWAPDARCGQLATEPAAQHGTFPGCELGPVSAMPSQTCGPAYGSMADAGAVRDAGTASDAGTPTDAGTTTDAGLGGGARDAGTASDAGRGDAGMPVSPGADGGTTGTPDAGSAGDASAPVDGSSENGRPVADGAARMDGSSLEGSACSVTLPGSERGAPWLPFVVAL
jgi:hypothetical protein